MFGWDDYDGISRFVDECWEKFKADDLGTDPRDIAMYSRRNLTSSMARLMERLITVGIK